MYFFWKYVNSMNLISVRVEIKIGYKLRKLCIYMFESRLKTFDMAKDHKWHALVEIIQHLMCDRIQRSYISMILILKNHRWLRSTLDLKNPACCSGKDNTYILFFYFQTTHIYSTKPLIGLFVTVSATIVSLK